jgi:hypothetical protein
VLADRFWGNYPFLIVMTIRFLLITFLLMGVLKGFPQQGHSYRAYKRTVCNDSERAYGRKPVEIDFNISLYDNMLVAVYTDKEWFDEFFSKHSLSLATQLVTRDYFDCDESPAGNLDQYFFNTSPLSHRQLKNNRIKMDDGWFMSPLGEVPEAFREKEYDYGLIISRRGRKCIDHWYTRMIRRDWDFLNTALMIDTLVFDNDHFTLQSDTLPIATNSLREHTVLFEKDQLFFDKEPLLDFIYSLPLADYDIMRIDIKAYASVEGPENRNEELYWGRADAIFKELSGILPDNIIYEFDVSEAWDDFRNDIAHTSFSGLARKKPEEIRKALQNEQTAKALEPILKNHRKTVVTVHLNMNISPGDSSKEELMHFYRETLENEDIENAMHIQDAIFTRIQDEAITAEFPTDIPMPHEQDFSVVYNRDYSYRYLMDITNLYEAHDLFMRLAAIYPENRDLHFNLAELELRRWLLRDTMLTDAQVLAKINNLNKHDVPTEASHRLLVNYHKAMVVKSMLERDDRKRTRSLNAIRGIYAGTIMQEKELISLSRFFVSYHRRDLAERLLRPFARIPFPDEEILFYYINITIAESPNVSARWYRDMLLRAHRINPRRFCNIFEPLIKEGAQGLSLLFNESLKELYCTHCR